MLLGFKAEFDGKPTGFLTKIEDGFKLHTMREDTYKRWKAGMTIQFSTGVRTKQFKEHFRKPCTAIQEIKMTLEKGSDLWAIQSVNIFVDGKLHNPLLNQQFARNDGFTDQRDFLKWFFFEKKNGKWKQVRTSWKGRLIHWTDLRY